MEAFAVVLAGLIGNAVMTLPSGSEMQSTGRGKSPAPGVAAVWPLKLVGINIDAMSPHGGLGVGILGLGTA